MTPLMTIERHILEQQKQFPQASGRFTRLLQDIALAAKIVARETTRAGLVNILGATDEQNVFGERQQKLDQFADETLWRMVDHTGVLAGVISEEYEGIRTIPDHYETGNYVLIYDPLDGSSNIDVNTSIGTIFAVHRKYTRGRDALPDDALQEGKRLVAAGYVIYGSSTMMVYTTGQGVYGFTLDPSLGEFILSHPKIVMPSTPTYYSVNQGNQKYWYTGVQAYIAQLQGLAGDEEPLQQRYVGSLVSDFHRNLLKGGIFLYPADQRTGRQFGKLRLLMESQPMAFIIEQAGGYASDGVGNLLHVLPHHLEQTSPLFMGDLASIQRLEALIREHDTDWLTAYSGYRNTRPR
jgi:fructose-1,6-bisphosphatase I